MEWLEETGRNPDVSDRYKALYRIYKFGIYDQPKFLNKFNDFNDNKENILLPGKQSQ